MDFLSNLRDIENRTIYRAAVYGFYSDIDSTGARAPESDKLGENIFFFN